MRVIGTKTHGMLDYLMGALLIASPWIFNFDRGGAETWVPVILGVSALIYSLFTNYEMGASRQLSMRTHLTLDLMSGILLAASPWLFGFADYVWAPHLALGLFEVVASLMTKRHSSTEGATRHHHTHAMH